MKTLLHLLPPPLLILLLATLTTASPSPALVPDDLIHLMPRNVLFFRQAPASSSSDLQTFKQGLGGISASPITDSGDDKRPFAVEGDTFTDFESAAQRSCDRQFQGCSEEANQEKAFEVGQCDEQKEQCRSAQDAAQVKDFSAAPAVVASKNIGQDPEFDDFDLICDA